ncbi:hypothetical protein QOT17_008417 [Balamuthia mandrillaris]
MKRSNKRRKDLLLTLDALPYDVLLLIFSHLEDPWDLLLNVSLVSRHFHAVVSQSDFLWKRIYVHSLTASKEDEAAATKGDEERVIVGGRRRVRLRNERFRKFRQGALEWLLAERKILAARLKQAAKEEVDDDDDGDEEEREGAKEEQRGWLHRCRLYATRRQRLHQSLLWREEEEREADREEKEDEREDEGGEGGGQKQRHFYFMFHEALLYATRATGVRGGEEEVAKVDDHDDDDRRDRGSEEERNFGEVLLLFFPDLWRVYRLAIRSFPSLQHRRRQSLFSSSIMKQREKEKEKEVEQGREEEEEQKEEEREERGREGWEEELLMMLAVRLKAPPNASKYPTQQSHMKFRSSITNRVLDLLEAFVEREWELSFSQPHNEEETRLWFLTWLEKNLMRLTREEGKLDQKTSNRVITFYQNVEKKMKTKTKDTTKAKEKEEEKATNNITNKKLWAYSPAEIAKQLTLEDATMFRTFDRRDFLFEGWLKDPDATGSLRQYICRFNALSHALIYSLFTIEDSKTRAQHYEKLVSIAIHLKKLRNFNSLTCIVVTLQQLQLERTIERVGKKYKRKLAKYYEQTKTGAYALSNYQSKMQTTSPVIPYMGTILYELIFADSISPDRFSKRGLEWRGMENTCAIVMHVADTQLQVQHFLDSIPCNARLSQAIQEALKESERIDAKALHSLGRQLRAESRD